MRIVKQPKVYLITRPQLVNEGLDEFLIDQGLEWPTPRDGTDAETAVEVAGRCCYMSFGAKAGSKTNYDYIQNLLGRNKDGTFKSGPAHGCYDSETEVLTFDGWKQWDEVTEKDLFATLNSNNIVEYHEADRYIHYYHKGDMYRVDGKGVDLLVTPDHKMFTCITTTKEGRKKNKFELIKASEIDLKSHAYIKGGNKWVDDNMTGLLPSIFALLGFTIGDGTTYVDNRTAKFNIKLERKIAYLKRIANDCGYEFSDTGYDYRVRLPEGKVFNLFKKIYNDKGEKQIPNGLLCSLNKECLEALYDGLLQSDGSIDKNDHAIYDTTSEVLAGQFQQLCLHIGLAANISQSDCYSEEHRKSSSSFGNKQLFRVHVIRDKYLKPEFNKFDGHKSRTRWIQNWEGDVYCVEVPNNTLYVRRNGKAVWSGNSVVEHPCWTFLVVGAGRGFSHEQVRHRVGWAYSQLSTRYCDFEREEEEGTWDPGFVIPPLAQLSEHTTEAFQRHIEESQKAYQLLLGSIMADLEKDPGFQDRLAKLTPRERKRMLRKAARGAARDILPIATEAIMTMSANARSIWNTIYLRANEHAEAAIRSVYVQIAQIMEKEMPSLFHGLEYYKTWDGTLCVRLPREKL